MSYNVGDVVRLAATFKDSSGALVDPSTVTFKTTVNGSTTSYVYGVGGSGVVRDSLGTFHKDVTVSTATTWTVRAESTGSGEGAEQRTFRVST